MKSPALALAALAVAVAASEPRAQVPPPAARKPAPPPQSRRTLRVVALPPVTVVSPNGQLTFSLSPNAERLTFTVKLQDTTIVEPSPIVMQLDSYDLSAGVVSRGVITDQG